MEYNDGFSGSFERLFKLSNFNRSFFRKSLHYDNTYELPVFNLIKLHGSLTWTKGSNEENILFDRNLESINNLKDYGNKHKICDKFINKYEENLLIINPTEEKFKTAVLNKNYYELLRIYSSELEKENTALFVMGFSFSDEHIREVTVRAANSNPTLGIYILPYNQESEKSIRKELEKSHPNNENIRYISNEIDNSKEESCKEYNFKNINKLFGKLLDEINKKNGK